MPIPHKKLFSKIFASIFAILLIVNALITPTLVEAVAWVISDANYDSISVGSIDMASDIQFNSDGSVMYVLKGDVPTYITQYNLSSPWDISTASSNGTYTFNTGDGLYWGTSFSIKPDGTKLYLVADARKIHQMSFGTPWDVSTLSYDSVFIQLGVEETNPSGIFIKSDGLKVFISGNTGDNVLEYAMSPAWDLSSLSLTYEMGVICGDVGSCGGVEDVHFKDDGTKMYVLDEGVNKIFQYTLSSAWDLSSKSYDSVSKTMSSYCYGFVMGNAGTKLYAAYYVADAVYQYSLVDSTAPTISTVSSSKANGSYNEGDVIDIDVYFSENVTSTGNVTVTLETGEVDRTCTFSISNNSFGTCNYTVQAGDTSADLNATISGTIADQSSNPMTNYTPTTSLASAKNLIIDTTAPTITSISSDTANGSYKTGDTIDIDVTFSENVTSTGSVTVTLETGAVDQTCTFSVSNASTGTCNYTIQSGDYSADLNATVSGTIADTAGNSMTNYVPSTTLATNKALIADGVAPTILSISSDKANGTYGAAVVIDIDVTFSENVTSTGDITVTLETGDTDRTCTFSVSNASSGTCNYTVQNGDASLDLDATITGTVADQAGNSMASFTPTTSLATNKDLVIQTNQAPTVATVTFTQSTAGDGDVTITFIMDDPDDDDTLQAKIEYSLNGGSTWADPTLSTTGSETTATYGDPAIDNGAVTYQVGTGAAYITSSSGANTVSIVWEAATDVLATTDITNAQIKVTPYDGTEAGTPASSSNSVLDLVSPAALASFTRTNASIANATFTWTAATDSNFNHYEVWYGANQSDVQGRTGTASEWDNSDDATLATVTTATTTVTSDPRNKYFKIFAIDDFGNQTTLSDVLVTVSSTPNTSGDIGIPTNISVTDNASGGVTITWTDPDDTASTYVQIMRGISPYPVNATPIANIPVGTKTYTDTTPTTGQIVTYMLRATDGSNSGTITAQYVFTVGSTLTSNNGSSGGGGGGGGSSSSSNSTTSQDEEIVEEDTSTQTVTSPNSLEELGITAPNHWSEGYLKNLDEVQQVLTQAVEAESFYDLLVDMFTNPDKAMNRGLAVQMLVTLSDYNIETITVHWLMQGFLDISQEHELASYIQFAYEHGLVNGYPDGNFNSEKIINRAEALKMTMSFFEIDIDTTLRGNELLSAYQLTSSPFSDIDLEAWYVPYVIHAYSNGVIRGYGDGTFGPGNQVTYAEFVKIATLIKDIENAIELASELQN